jgi:hypothetical protein
LEANFQVRSLRPSRRVRVASRMTQLARLGRANRWPGRSAYWGTPAEHRRAREVVGVAESDPTLPSAAPAEHGSYLGISCRQLRWCITAEDDPSPTPTVHRSKERKCSSRGYNLEVGGSVNRHAPISYSIHLFVTRRGCHPLFGGGSADWYDSDKPESRGHQSDRQSRSG